MRRGSSRFAASLPGSYKLFAFEGLTGGEFYNSRFLSKYEFRGKPINVAQGGYHHGIADRHRKQLAEATMKTLLIDCSLVVAGTFAARAARGSVTGTVIVSGTSEPIADADVAIVTSDGVLETTTDAAVALRSPMFLPAGKRLSFERTDSSSSPQLRTRLFAARAEVPVTVTAGATPVAIPNVSMVRGGTVSGKVVDPSGNPMPFVRVQALRPEAGTLNSGVMPDFGNRMTDDRGEYRMFFVPPGEYVIRAQVQGGRPAGPVPTRPGEMQTLVSTLFPNTTDMAQAGKVNVKSGEEVRGIDISVKMEVVTLPPPAPKPTGGVRISGLVIDGVLPMGRNSRTDAGLGSGAGGTASGCR